MSKFQRSEIKLTLFMLLPGNALRIAGRETILFIYNIGKCL